MALNFCNNNSLSAITSIPAAISGGSLNLISTQTASSSSSLSFTSGIDSTYKEYIFKYINCHPSVNIPHWTFQGSTNAGSSFGVTITSTNFNAYHAENDSEAVIEYVAPGDLAQSTNYQRLLTEVNYSDDGSVSGALHLFEPSSTTFVKHFLAKTTHGYNASPAFVMNSFIAGYFNTQQILQLYNLNLLQET